MTDTEAKAFIDQAISKSNEAIALMGQAKGAMYDAPTTPTPPTPTPPGAIPPYGGATGYEILNQSDPGMQAEISLWKNCHAQYLRTDSTTGNQTQFDRLLRLCAAAGMKMMPVLHGTSGPITDVTFDGAQAQKFKGNPSIVGFELCNEPDLNGWVPVNYASYVKSAAAKIKGIDSSRLVVAGALWTGAGGPQAFVKEIVKQVPKGQVDAISMHLYDPPQLRGSWSMWDRAYPHVGGTYNGNTVREILDSAGWNNVPIISTESGGPRNKYGEQGQADIVRLAIGEVKAGKIASICVYNMKPEVTDFYIDGHAAYGAYQAAAT